jgi:hypothetical protein
MDDWASDLQQIVRHEKKATEALTMLHGGLSRSYAAPLEDTAEEHLWELLKHAIKALVWVYVRRELRRMARP